MKRSMDLKWPAFFLAILLLAIPAQGAFAAEEGAKAAFKKFHTIVDLDFMKKHATIPKNNDVMIVDSRPKSRKYDKGHIPTAVSIPWRTFDKHVAMLPEDKSKLLVFYCGGLKCSLSHKSAFKAEELGYTNVKVFATGYPSWIKAGELGAVSGPYVKKLIDTKAKAMIIDSRPKARKYDKGHIPTSVSIPWREFDKHVAALPEDKSTLLVFYCGGVKCKLSPKSAMKAKELGYTNVKTYPEGYPEWVKLYGKGPAKASDAGKAPAKAAMLDIKPGPEEGSISIASFKKAITEYRDQIVLVDVRDASEYGASTFKGAINMPVDDVEKKVAELPTDKTVVFVCNTGGMAGEAYDIAMLVRSDLKAFFLNADVTYNKDGSHEIKPATN